MSTAVIDVIVTAAVTGALGVMFILAAVAAWALEHRGGTQLDRVLAQCERERAGQPGIGARLCACAVVRRDGEAHVIPCDLHDDALWAEMERQVRP